MNKFNAKLSAAVAMAVVIATTLAPVSFASTRIKISDNGNNSINKVTVNKGTASTTIQSNGAVVLTEIFISSNTGNNKANKNTGIGGTTTSTGNSNIKAGVVVDGSKNIATDPDCGCVTGNTKIKVSDNGNNSTNIVTVNDGNINTVNQSNKTIVRTIFVVDSNTGDNEANNNTGAGGTNTSTGNSNTQAGVIVNGSINLNP